MFVFESTLIVFFALCVTAILWVRSRALAAEQRTRYEAGIPATALIIEAHVLESEKPDQQIPAILRFWVEPPGGMPFKARAFWLINSKHLLAVRTGQSFPVRIDAVTNEVIFPNVDWAKYDWQRAQVVARIHEDTRPIKKKIF